MRHLWQQVGQPEFTCKCSGETEQPPRELGKPHKEQRLQINDNIASFSVKYSDMFYGSMFAWGDHFPPVRCAYLL